MKEILLVEGAAALLAARKKTLEAEGYQVFTALDGGEALQKVQEARPDVAVLDIMMPGIDGFRVCRFLRGNPATADLPVLMFTGRSGPRDLVSAFESGADDYLTKSVSIDEVVSRVKALLWAEAL